MRAPSDARLYLDDVKQAESSGWWSLGSKVMLDENQSYQGMVVGKNPVDPADSNDNPCVEMRVKFFSEQRLTSAWTGNAIQETQIIRLTSTVKQDVQRISFSGFSSQDWLPEITRLCIEGSAF